MCPSLCRLCLSGLVTSDCYSLSLHDALPILEGTACACCKLFHRRTCRGIWASVRRPIRSSSPHSRRKARRSPWRADSTVTVSRSEEHTSELQSLTNLVCRLLLEKKKQQHRQQ